MVASKCVTLLLRKSAIAIVTFLLVSSLIIYALVNLTTFKDIQMTLTDMEFWPINAVSENIFAIEESNGHVHRGAIECQESAPKRVFNCSVLDFLATADPTVKGLDCDLVCDEFSEKYDIVCRLYLRQIGLGCLESTICPLDDPGKVPRIVYYVIFGVYEFKFLHYVSVTAATRFIKPMVIYVIGDQHPTGKWWQEVLKNIHGVRFLYRENPGNISGLPASGQAHLSDIVRLQILYLNGGIYLDADMVVLKDLEPLLGNDLTMGSIASTQMANAFIVTKRRNTFVHEWYAEYMNYKRNNTRFYWNSMMFPMILWKKNASRVHMMSNKLYRPNWYELELLFNNSVYPWHNNFAVHVWGKNNLAPKSPEEIQTANTTIAQIFRYVLYGDERVRGKVQI